jgi:hypothetical protein
MDNESYPSKMECVARGCDNRLGEKCHSDKQGHYGDGLTTRPRSASRIASRQACHAPFSVSKRPLVIHGYWRVEESLSGRRIDIAASIRACALSLS